MDPLHVQAIQAWNLLANGMGGLDWAGLPLVAEYLRVEDPEALILRLAVIKKHRPKKDDTGAPDDGPGDSLD